MQEARDELVTIVVEMRGPNLDHLDTFVLEILALLLEKRRYSPLAVDDAIPHLEVNV
jgi:hypothetical protein